jgi:sulfonate dioxygenase
LTEGIGTLLEGVQLSQLNGTQLDELALLVSERGVVFFRDQDLTTEQQENCSPIMVSQDKRRESVY